MIAELLSYVAYLQRTVSSVYPTLINMNGMDKIIKTLAHTAASDMTITLNQHLHKMLQLLCEAEE